MNMNTPISNELSRITQYFDELIDVLRLPHDTGALFETLKCRQKKLINSTQDISDSQNQYSRRAFFLNGQLNYENDIQNLLKTFYSKMNRFDRIVAVTYNPYLYSFVPLYRFLTQKKIPNPTTFLTQTSLQDIAQVAGFQVVRLRPILPFGLHAIPLVRALAWKWVVVLRPIKKLSSASKISIIIPARNEKGNIENAILQMPPLSISYEIVFVEGNSTDDTWGEILRIKEKYKNTVEISCFKQTGKGKNDAVRVGFEKASGDLLTILDADLTMPPEKLPLFVDAFIDGHGDFVNGDRLVYPMEAKAMRFLNRLGNIFFAKALSFTLETRLGDSLCGTKLLTKRDYDRIVEWRGNFGDFDPFGDFELLFGATILGLGIIDMPIKYKERVYGETNIHRFRHGLQLLKMTLIGLLKIRAAK